MAKKKTKKNEVDADIDMDFDDLSDLGEDMDFEGEDGLDVENREPSRSKVFSDLAKEAGQGALEGVIKNTAKKALPEEYESGYYDVMDLASFTSEVILKNKNELNKATFRLGKEVKKLLPFKLGMLDNYLEKQQSEFETYKSQSEEEMRNAGIGAELGGIFDKQLEMQKMLQARDDAQTEVDQKERLIQNKLSQDVLTNMDHNIAHQTAFVTQISKEYYRRSLELQFKSYYVQADTLKTMREHYKAFTIQFTNIEKNTSLPDFVKLRNTEKLQDLMREQTVQSIYRQVFSNSKYLETMKKRMGGFVSEKVSNVTNSMDEATNVLEMLNTSSEGGGSSALASLAGMLSAMGGDTLGEKISSKFAPHIKEKIKDNKVINTGANLIGTFSASPSSLVENLKAKAGKASEDMSDEASPLRWLGSKLFGGARSLLEAATPGGENMDIKQSSYLDHNQPAFFDKNVHRSITEVIPMYLARILQTNTNLTSMYSQTNGGIQGGVDLQLYDFQERKFSSGSDIAKNIQKSLFKEKTLQHRTKGLSASLISGASSQVSSSTTLNKDEKKGKKKFLAREENKEILNKYVEKAMLATGGDVSFERLFQTYETDDKLKGLFDDSPEGKKLKLLVDTIAENKPADVKYTNERMKDINQVYPIETLKNMVLKVSEIARSAIPHQISDPHAQILSKTFYNYILKTGRDVIAQEVLSRKAFTYMLLNDATEDVLGTVRILIHDVQRVLKTNDTHLVTQMELLFALMNRSIKEGQEISPDVFKSLNSLYPSLVDKGIASDKNKGGLQLSGQNVREGQLTIGGDAKYINELELIEVTPLSGEELQDLRQDNLEKSFAERLKQAGMDKFSEMSQFARANRNDPSAIAKMLLDNIRQAKGLASDKVKTLTAELTSNVEDFAKSHGLTPEELEKKGLTVMIAKYDKLLEKLQSLQTALAQETRENVDLIDQTDQNLDFVSNDQQVRRDIGKATKVYRQKAEATAKALSKTIETLKKNRERLVELSTKEGSTVKERLEQMRTMVQDSFITINQAIKEYEASGKAIFDRT